MIFAKNFVRNYEKENTWNIRRLVDESFIQSTQCIILKIDGFLVVNAQVLVLVHTCALWYRKVESRSTSWLVAHSRIFRLFMKGKFDAYLLWPLDKRVQNWIVARLARSTARNFRYMFCISKLILGISISFFYFTLKPSNIMHLTLQCTGHHWQH